MSLSKETEVIFDAQRGVDYDSANPPLYASSTFHQKVLGGDAKYDYARSGNPNRALLEEKLAALEGGDYAFAYASGIAAISAVLLTLNAGDHVILPDDVYGGTFRLTEQILTRFNIQFTTVDTTRLQEIEEAIQSNTKLVYIETPSNPLLRVTDIKKTAELAQQHNLISVVDNTFMTPYFQNPLDFGIDIVLHSATKYLGGHSDVVSGLIATKDADLAERIGFIQNSTGGVLGPQDSYLLIRGIKTLGLRMEQVQKNTLAIIDMLQGHAAVQQVFHPSIETHLNYSVHKEQADGHTGVVAFEVKDIELAKAVIRKSQYFTLAESLGAVESLISVPALMTHASIPKDIREKEGIADGLVRLSVGIEDTKDLVEDLEQSLNALG